MDDSTVETFRKYLRQLGLDPKTDPELGRTPERVTALFQELFRGLHELPPDISVFELTEDASRSPVMITALPFYSTCVHHLLPFFGTVDVGYLPHKKMVGFSSIGTVIDHFAHRPQVQERMIAQIADYLHQELAPRALFVRLRARQLCMEMRGCQKTGELISTTWRGADDSHLQDQFLRSFERAQQPL